MTWREDLHPRDDLGRFTHKNNLPAVSIKATLANLRMTSDDDLMDVFGRLMKAKRLRTADLKAVDAELIRREGGSDYPEPEATPEERRVDDLVRKGWSYSEAYAYVFDKDAAKMGREERAAGVDRRKGETVEAARRRAYAEVVALEVLQAEEATRGNLTSKRCNGVDPATLWAGPVTRIRKCASEDLLRWWEANGGRKTYTTWKGSTGDTSARRRSKVSAAASNGRDFGV